jgi:hypothetical protein
MPRNSGAAGTLSSHHTNYGLIFCVSHPFLTNLQRFFISAGSGPRVVKRPGGGAAVSTSRSAAAAAAPPPPPWRRGALEAKQLNQDTRKRIKKTCYLPIMWWKTFSSWAKQWRGSRHALLSP